MLIEYDVQFIVMLCDVEENGKEKCAKYWDNKGLKNFTIEKRKDTTDLDKNLFKRCLTIKGLKDKNIVKNFDQIQFIEWEDHEGLTYEYFEKIIKMIQLVDNYKKDKASVPVVVHCSAGVGRTGTFICLYNLYHEMMEQIINKEIKEIKFSIMNLVRKVKEMRMISVENENQYHLLYSFANYILFKYNE